MSRAGLLVLLGVLSFVAVSAAEKNVRGWQKEDYPDPINSPQACARAGVSTSWICDPDSILTTKSRNVVDGVLQVGLIATQDHFTAGHIHVSIYLQY